jgi:hypothetical protein
MAGSDWIWSIAAAEANLRAHGVSFQLAVRVFQDPMSLSQGDASTAGKVWWTLGAPDLDRPDIVLLVQTEGASPDDRGRIIGARLATPAERQAYSQRTTGEEGRHGAAIQD